MKNSNVAIPIDLEEMKALKEFFHNYILFTTHVLDHYQLEPVLPTAIEEIKELHILQQWYLTLSASENLSDKLLKTIEENPQFFEIIINKD